MEHVFVSYTKADRSAAAVIISAITQAGLSVWHPELLRAGDIFQKVIEQKFDNALCIVVFWSAAAAESNYTHSELRRAIHAWSLDRLVLVALDNTPLPVGLRDLSPISVSDPSSAAIEQIVERINSIVKGGMDVIWKADTTQQPQHNILRVADFLDDELTPINPIPLRISSDKKFTRAYRYSIRSVFITILVVIVAFMGGFWLALTLRGGAPPLRGGALPLKFVLSIDLEQLVEIALLVLIGSGLLMAGTWLIFSWATRARRHSNNPPSVTRGALSEEGPPTEVFVSYSSKDIRTVEALVEQIRLLERSVWIDVETIGPRRYAGSIVHAIRTSKLVAVMASQNAFASDHVVREIYVAGDFKKPFIVFQLDSAQIPDEILYFISGFPRVPGSIDLRQLRFELARLIPVDH
jgi:hypothetical protein